MNLAEQMAEKIRLEKEAKEQKKKDEAMAGEMQMMIMDRDESIMALEAF